MSNVDTDDADIRRLLAHSRVRDDIYTMLRDFRTVGIKDARLLSLQGVLRVASFINAASGPVLRLLDVLIGLIAYHRIPATPFQLSGIDLLVAPASSNIIPDIDTLVSWLWMYLRLCARRYGALCLRVAMLPVSIPAAAAAPVSGDTELTPGIIKRHAGRGLLAFPPCPMTAEKALRLSDALRERYPPREQPAQIVVSDTWGEARFRLQMVEGSESQQVVTQFAKFHRACYTNAEGIDGSLDTFPRTNLQVHYGGHEHVVFLVPPVSNSLDTVAAPDADARFNACLLLTEPNVVRVAQVPLSEYTPEYVHANVQNGAFVVTELLRSIAENQSLAVVLAHTQSLLTQ